MTKYINDHHKFLCQLDEIKYSLYALSEAFYTTGNSVVSDKLDFLASKLEEAKKIEENMYSDLVNQMYNSSVQSSGNMIKAVLAFAEVGMEKKE